MIRSVAVIGIGSIGAPMAQRVRQAGFDLTVCDRNPEALASFAASGSATVCTARECANVDMVIVLVATPAQMHDVLLGEDGLQAGLSSGPPPLLAVMSTVPTDALLAVQQAMAKLGVRVIDAPISGGAIVAQRGELTIMTGGDPADIAQARPVFESFGDKFFHCGDVGAAQIAKAINNLVCIASTLVTAEAYRLAMQNGLDLALITSLLNVSTGRNYLTAEPAGVPAAYSHIANDRARFDGIIAILRKDIRLASALASGSMEELPVIQAMTALLDAAGDETFRNWNMVSEAS